MNGPEIEKANQVRTSQPPTNDLQAQWPNPTSEASASQSRDSLPVAVLQAHALGFSLIPANHDKKPYFAWKRYQGEVAGKEILTQWAKQYRPSAWAVVTGAISQLVVLDFDGTQGKETLSRLNLEPHVQTGSGGFHVYFEHPGWPVQTLNSKSKAELGKLYPGLDIRADGGYAVFCGRNGAGSYRQLRKLIPDPLSSVPDELKRMLGLDRSPPIPTIRATRATKTIVEPREGESSDHLLDRALERVSDEGRNNTGFWLVCQLRDNGYSEAEAESILRDYVSRVPLVNTKGQREPYTPAEALASLRQAYSQSPREPLGPPREVGEPQANLFHLVEGQESVSQFPPDLYQDARLPVVIADKKSEEALKRLSWHGLGDAAEKPNFLPIGLPKIEVFKPGAPIPDLDRVAWNTRRVVLVFDTNIKNPSVRAARELLTVVLEGRGAEVSWFNWPSDTPDGVKEINDYLVATGPHRILQLIKTASCKKEERSFIPPTYWKWLDVSKVKQWEVVPLQPIIQGIIAVGNFVFVAAQSQIGKTLLWLYIARYLVLGGNLFGKFAVTPVKKVVYLALEDPDRRIRDRLLDTSHEFPEPIEEGRLIVYVVPGFAINKSDHFAYLKLLVQEEAFDIVILDTYQRSTPGITSFDDEEQSKILHSLANLTRETAITLVVLDHVRKENKGGKTHSLTLDDIKGTGGKAQNADVVILMERTGKDRNQVKFQSFSKDFDAPIRILLDVAPQGSTEPKFKYVGDLSELASESKRKSEQDRASALEAISPDKWLKMSDLVNATKLSKSTLHRYMDEWINEGLVQRRGIGVNTTYCRSTKPNGTMVRHDENSFIFQ